MSMVKKSTERLIIVLGILFVMIMGTGLSVSAAGSNETDDKESWGTKESENHQ